MDAFQESILVHYSLGGGIKEYYRKYYCKIPHIHRRIYLTLFKESARQREINTDLFGKN